MNLDARTQFAWRQTTFGRMRKVPPFEAQRWRPTSRCRRAWTDDEFDLLIHRLDAGDDYATIARRLGRTKDAIVSRLKRAQAPLLFRRATVLTATEVARLLGMRNSVHVVGWIGAGALRARALSGGRPAYRVRWDDLMAFLRNEQYWMAWDAHAITDSDLREECSALRASGPQWLSAAAVAARYYVSVWAVHKWISRGSLRGTRYMKRWWVRADDLVGWTPPCER